MTTEVSGMREMLGDNEYGLITKNTDEDFETGSYEKEDEKKESEQNYVSVNESIEMEVETQGIPMEQLLAKGKSMFSHVNFNK